MDVTFHKAGERRYRVGVQRDRGPTLATRQGPGYHDYLPHDIVHFVVEAEAGLTGAIFGQVASGYSGFWWTDQPRSAHTKRRYAAAGWARAQMLRSEQLAEISLARWAGRAPRLPVDPADEPVLARIHARLTQIAPRWHELPVDGSLTLRWPHPAAPARSLSKPKPARDRARGLAGRRPPY
jgi:hypothetical protein